MLPILACLAGAKWGGVERENPPPFCPYLLMAYPLRRHVGMYHPKLRGRGMFFAPFWSENGHRLCAHFGLNSVMVFEGTEGVYERSN